MRNLTEEELENSPHKEYHEWRNENGIKPGHDGSVWRMKIGTNEEEKVFTATYQDKPIFSTIQGVDGECLWLEIKTYDQWENYYNQNFTSSSAYFQKKGMMSDYLVVVDLHDGTMRFIETEGAKEDIITYY